MSRRKAYEPGTSVSCGATATRLVDNRPGRTKVALTNPHATTDIWICFADTAANGGTDAVVGNGMLLAHGTVAWITDDGGADSWDGPINGITTTGSVTVGIVEI